MIHMILKDRVAIITGSGRGLGKAIALALAKEGAKLVLMSRTEKELQDVVKGAGLSEKSVAVIKGDISREPDVKRMADLALSRFGTVDILVNNAGIIGPIGPTDKVKVSDWISNISINLIGTFLCTRAILPILIAKKRGKIINIAGSGERPLPNFSAYAASKSAVIRLTETLPSGGLFSLAADVNSFHSSFHDTSSPLNSVMSSLKWLIRSFFPVMSFSRPYDPPRPSTLAYPLVPNTSNEKMFFHSLQLV